MSRLLLATLWLSLLTGLLVNPAGAAISVGATGAAGNTAASLPDTGGSFTLDKQPLSKNGVNTIRVTAVDANGNKASKEIKVTQVSLDSIVVSRVTSERLSVQQVEQLVSEGVIKLDDPANYNVSTFDIVLTIANEQIPVRVPIATPIAVPEETGEEVFKMPAGGDGGGGRAQDQPPIEIVVFQQPVAVPDAPPIIIPGVILIEGNIKSLKEFYTVRLLLMNTSGIFTLKDVNATIAFPDGGLSKILPADGLVAFGDIGPGEDGLPGQAEKQFIIRGDDIGVRKVKVDFGGKVAGPGIPEDEAIPFNGSANTQVEVKGPPEFQVRVTHPDRVEAGVPYELKVDIANVGDLPALYASLELDVGADANLMRCSNDTGTPVCEEIRGSEIRSFGHIQPGGSVAETFTVLPKASGPIGSCVAGADQNIKLQVYVGDIGCLVGSYPPKTANPDGIPTVNVVPTPNTQGVKVETPVTAFFSEPMNLATITTGPGGTFNVYDRANNLIQGQLRKEVLNNKTVVIWQVADGVGNRLAPETEYTVVLTNGIFDPQGNPLASRWVGTFTTTASGTNDTTPPNLSLLVSAPVNPNHVIPGEIVKLEAYAADQGTGVGRVELRSKDLGDPNAAFVLVDQRTASAGDKPPYLFPLDSGRLTAGHSYRVQATAYDKMGNFRSATLDLVIAENAQPPTIVLPADATDPVPRGISVPITPESISGSATEVRYFLDQATVPFATVTLAPFKTSLPTLELLPGDHQIRAVARDGLGQEGTDSYAFKLVPNGNRPSVSFPGSVDGAKYVTGARFALTGRAVDALGLKSQAYFLDAPVGTPLASGTDPFEVNTAGLSIGAHRIYLVATNALDVTNDPTDPASYLEFLVVEPGQGSPPPAPTGITVTPPTDGLVTVTGSGPVGARIDVTNTANGLTVSGFAGSDGRFSVQIPGQAGDAMRIVAVDPAQSAQASEAATQAVEPPPVLQSLNVSPVSIAFNALNATRDIQVVGHYSNGSDRDVTADATYSSSSATVAAVSAAGRVAAIGDGSAEITVSFGALVARVPVTVQSPTLTGITVSPTALALIGAGQNQALNVTGVWSDGQSRPLTSSPSFLSADPAVATVSVAGLVSSAANGTTAITVSVAGVAAVNVPVTVKTLDHLSLSPTACDLIGSGKTCALSALGVYTDGSTVALSGVGFESGDAAVATVDGNGLVTSAGLGSTTVTARYAGLTPALANVTVRARTAIQLQVSPSSILLTQAGQSVPLTVTAQFNDGSAGPATGVGFTAQHPDIATVAAEGVVTAVSNGQTTIDVAAAGMTASVPVTVDIPSNNPPPEIQSIDRPRAGENDPFVLRGKNFSATPGGNIVRVGGLPALVQSARADELTVIVPKGAVSGDVTVTVGGQTSNAVSIAIYARKAQSVPVTIAIDAAANPGQSVGFTVDNVDFRANDVAYLSSAPDVLAPLSFNGGLNLSVDGSAAQSIVATTPASSITDGLSAGNRSLNLTLSESGGRIRSGAIHLLYGPIATGTVGGVHSMPVSGMSRQIPVTFVDLPVADGGKVVISTFGGCSFGFNDVCVQSAGGSIANGEYGPDWGANPQAKVFTVVGGRVDVLFDPGSIALTTGQTAVSSLAVLPANGSGGRIGSTALAVQTVALSAPDTVAGSRNASSVIADGFSKIVTVTLAGFRDSFGNALPDGTKIIVSTFGGCTFGFQGACVQSAGGRIANGDYTADWGANDGAKVFTIADGKVEVQYDPGSTLLGAGQTATANLSILGARPNNSRIGGTAFQVVPITLSSAFVGQLNVTTTPGSLLADYADNRVVVAISGFKDAVGNPVPNGTKVLVATFGGCAFGYNSNCVQSAGGNIVNGEYGPDWGANPAAKVFTVQNGSIEVVYSSAPIGLSTGQSATASLSILPAQPNGARIGNTALAVATVTLNAYQTVQYSVAPVSAVADGFSKIVKVTLTGFKDAGGNPIPNGAKVLVASFGGCSFGFNSTCVQSAGGNIVNGAYGPDWGANPSAKVFTVVDDRVDVEYDPAGLLFSAGQTGTANLSILPARPDGGRIGNTAFQVVPVALSSAFTSQVNVSVVPASVLADNGDNRVVATVTGFVDALGNPVPDGTKVLAATFGGCSFGFNGTCVQSAGGNIVNGDYGPDWGANPAAKVLTVMNGRVDVVYSAGPIALGSGATTTASIAILPAQPNGSRIGNTAIAVASVNLAGMSAAEIAGIGAVASTATATYTVTDIRDAAGKPVPDGAKIVVSTLGGCTHSAGGSCVQSAGGSLLNGETATEFGNVAHTRVFTVSGGAISVDFQSPAGAGTAVLQLLPGRPNGTRIGNVAFAVKSIAFEP